MAKRIQYIWRYFGMSECRDASLPVWPHTNRKVSAFSEFAHADARELVRMHKKTTQHTFDPEAEHYRIFYVNDRFEL